MSKQIDKQTGKKKTVITLSELETIANNPCFYDEENDFERRIDIVEFPPATADVVETIANNPCFYDEENDFERRIDIVEFPPATADVVSDEEEIDEDDLGEQSPKDITGCIEIHATATGTDSAVSIDPGNTEKKLSAKIPRKKVESSWQKTRPDFYMKKGSESNIDEMVRKRKEQFRKSLQLRFLKNFLMMR